ncbi:MAG: M23 family metallopeptidase [Desulfobulbaceae bacterium]|nr:M23 family metallopeptidase [Desulfobulbaceae bacterium]
MRFDEMLAAANGLPAKGFVRWVFADGMAFGAECQWWGGRARRAAPHEGVDFCWYETAAGGLGELAAGSLVPAAMDGVVIHSHADFLGRSLWLRHAAVGAEGRFLYSVYGHLAPDCFVAPGEEVSAGAIIGVVAQPVRAGKTIAPHLHLTVAWVANTVASADLDWSLARNTELMELLDPLSL